METDIIVAIIAAVASVLAAIVQAIIGRMPEATENEKRLLIAKVKIFLSKASQVLFVVFLMVVSYNVGKNSSAATGEPPETEPTPPTTTVSSETTEATETTETVLASETSALSRITVGSVIEFGSCEQDGKEINGEEAIEWIVLKREGNEALLLSVLGLDVFQYAKGQEESDWEHSSIRERLNTKFYENAFSDEEKARISEKEIVQHKNPDYPACDQGDSTKDKVFLLSMEEYLTYMYKGGNFDEIYCYGTPSAEIKSSVDLTNNKYCWWWLRTSSKDNQTACAVTAYGAPDPGSHSIHADKGMIRPAMWITVE